MAAKPAFTFGVNCAPRSGADIVETARKLESLGYHAMLMPDGPSQGVAPFPALAMAATATTTLHVGTYVLSSSLFHPFHIAHAAASLHALSGGRFVLGLGAGRPGSDIESTMLGKQPGTPGARIARLQATAAAVRALLHGQTVTAEVDGYSLQDAVLPGWMTTGTPVPVLVAGAGPRLLAMASGVADIVSVGLTPMQSWDDVRGVVGVIREGEQTPAQRPTIGLNLSGAGDRLASWFDRMPADVRTSLLAADRPAMVWGTPDDMVEGLLRRHEEFGATHVVISEDLADVMAPVVAKLSA